MHDLVISGGRVVRGGSTVRLDLGISGERIAEIAPRIDSPARRRIDATDLLVLPGGIDPHVHLALPTKGATSSDDPKTGTAAALFGGVTTVIDFTLQCPGERPADSLRARLAAFDGAAHCDYALHTNLTDFPDRRAGLHDPNTTPPDSFESRLDEDLAELERLGSTSLKVFTAYSREGMSIPAGRLRSVLRKAEERGFRVLVHAEDDQLLTAALSALEAAGRTGIVDFPRSRPAQAEARAIQEVCGIAREEGAGVYFVHVSTAAGADAIRSARRLAPAPVYMETCPQYLALDETRYAGPDGAQYLVAPPLRTPADRAALLDAIGADEVDVVATDHCPFRVSDKAKPGAPFFEVPNGLPGVETRLALLHELAVRNRRIGIERLVELTSTTPAKIFGLYPRKGCIEPQSDADLILFDPNARWVIKPEALHMATDFSPYEGLPVSGSVRTVILRGRVVIENGKLAGSPSGRYLTRQARGRTHP